MELLPDWVGGDHSVMLLSGLELVAYKHPKEDWKIKKVRCNQCGQCCHDTPVGHTPFGSKDDVCNMLEFESGKFHCRAGFKRPYKCLPDPIPGIYSECCIRYF